MAVTIIQGMWKEGSKKKKIIVKVLWNFRLCFEPIGPPPLKELVFPWGTCVLHRFRLSRKKQWTVEKVDGIKKLVFPWCTMCYINSPFSRKKQWVVEKVNGIKKLVFPWGTSVLHRDLFQEETVVDGESGWYQKN